MKVERNRFNNGANHRKTRRVLFVDDETSILDGIRRALHKHKVDWLVSFVCKGEAALEALREERYDVVVSDYHMPGMNGAELFHEIRQFDPQIVQVILTGSTRMPEEIARNPQIRLLTKPCSIEKLVEEVNKALFSREFLGLQFIHSIKNSFKDLDHFPNVQINISSGQTENQPVGQPNAEVICEDLGIHYRIPLAVGHHT